MGRKKWKTVPYDKEQAQILAAQTGEDPFAVLLLHARGYTTPDAIGDFIDAGEILLSSPYLLRGMDAAVARIRAALDAGERILVYGDYDCDGVTATALLYSYLQTVGAEVDYYIPSRERDGYGLSPRTAAKIVEGGFSLVVTVDNGIAALEEADFLKENGVDLVVTDHHQTGETLPRAVAVVDPHLPDDRSPCKDLAGVGVALKLCAALEDGSYTEVLQDYADLVTLGTVADIVPLVGENRTLVINGLKAIRETDRTGLRAMMESLSLEEKEMTSSVVAFALAPRINAAGRMGNADAALELLLTEEPERAKTLAEELNAANAARQETEGEILTAVRAQLAADPAVADARVIVVAGKNWHPGVIGIVAARLVDTYGKPAAVISVGEDGVCRGSCRSVEGFALYDALAAVGETLVQFGGHTLAAGFSVEEEKIPAFRRAINEYARACGDIYPVLPIDCRLNPAHITAEILDSLRVLEPFGAGNPQPVFGIFGVTLQSVKPIGNNRHVRLTVVKNNVTVPLVFFGMTAERFPYQPGDAVDVALRVEKNVYLGETRVSLQVKDIRPAGSDDDALFASLWSFAAAKRREPLTPAQKAALLPDRALLGKIYKAVKNENAGVLPPEVLAARLGLSSGQAGRVLAGLWALTEVGVLTETETGWADAGRQEKAALSDSGLLRFLSEP